jgi:hypothetical protein
VQLAEGAGTPGLAVPRAEGEEAEWGTDVRLVVVAVGFAGLVFSLAGSLIFRAVRSRFGAGHV